MDRSNLPKLPIPEPTRGKEPGTWACATISGRMPEIASRVLKENELLPAAVKAIEALIADMPDAPIRFMDEPEAADAALWQACIRPYIGQNWLEPPWFFVENYFYRRILEATGYFRPGPLRGYDPFRFSKEQGLTSNEATIAALAIRLEDWNMGGWLPEVFAGLLTIALWGNQGDLSLWPADAADRPDHSDPLNAGAHILANDTAEVYAHLTTHFGRRMDVVTDNAGYEFVADLALVDYLLATGAAERLILNVKSHPYFVSDVTIPDVEKTIAWLVESKEDAVQRFGQRLVGYQQDGRLQAQTHAYWSSPLVYWEMPEELRETLSASTLLIFKGDANYRRLLGDFHWLYTTPFTDIVRPSPTPVLALRTLKAELASGLEPAQIVRLEREEPNWMINGRWGVIQFSGPED